MRANALLRYLLRYLCCAVLSVPLISAHASGPGCDAPISLGQKPVMGDFADYTEFLVTIMAYKARAEDQRAHRKLCPELYRPAPVVEAPTTENLDQAVAASRDNPPFDYDSHETWYNKTTSRSFGLPDMPNNQMSSETIQTPLAMMDQPASQEYQQNLIAVEQLTQAFGLERWVDAPYSALLSPAATNSDKEVTQPLVKTTPSWDNVVIGSDGVLVSWYQGSTLVRTQTTLYYSDCWSSCYGK